MKRSSVYVAFGLLASAQFAFADGTGSKLGLEDPNDDGPAKPKEPAKPPETPPQPSTWPPPAGNQLHVVGEIEPAHVLPMEIGVWGGLFLSNYFHQFYDHSKFMNAPGGLLGRPLTKSSAPQFGLRYLYWFSGMIGAELDASFTAEGVDGGNGGSVSILHFGGSVVAQPMSTGKIRPFGELGFGVWDSMSSELGGAVHFPVHAGVGARAFITDSWAVRFDFRYYRGPGNRDPYTLAAGYADFGIGVSWEPHIGPKVPEPVHVDGDRDGDGIPDSKDGCPNEPEDKDQFNDEDGCPDPDNDNDGIPDAADKCPLDPEDFDGFQDADGCPDKDNDADGIPDVIDKCPNEPEDKDGHLDTDGCPDPDNDGDGIPDGSDKCPNEPETINGVQDEDGCPDRGDGLVILSPERLDLLDAIKFEKDQKISKKSASLLGQIGATLRAHGEILRLRITVHTQPSKTPAKDQEVSDKRANAIRDWLVAYGIDGKRLVSRGFGGTKPIVNPDQKGSALMNERVELIILERK